MPGVVTRFTELPAVAAYLALVLLAMAQALSWCAGGAVAGLLVRRARVPSWLAFAVGAYVATFVPTIFPWTPAGGLTPFPILVQSAEVVGERGTTFFLAASCGLFAGALERVRSERRMSKIHAIAGATVLALLIGHGALAMRRIDAKRAQAATARIALVQPDFDAFARWDPNRAAMMMDRLTELTKNAEARGAELTVWPESAYPYTLPHGTRIAPRGARAVLQPGVRGPVLTGAYLKKGNVGYNAAFLATADGAISKSYDKRHLLWFGETVPLADVFPFLRRIFARGTGLAPGTESVVFETGKIRASVLNCYEDTLPVAGREAMELVPNLLVNVTNDAWFAGSPEGELHLRLAVLRSIESRRDMVRAVNRGPTSWIDAAGRVVARRDPGPEGLGAPPALVVDAALLETPPTPYARFGDLPLLGILAVAIVLALRRARTG